MKNKFILFLLFLITIYFIVDTNSFIININQNTNFFLYKVFPPLFFFFIITDLLISYNFIKVINRLLQPLLVKVFNINQNSSFIFLMSLISGFPSGAKNIRNLYDKKQISINDANNLITYTHFSNIAFILGTINDILNNQKLTIIILISHFISNFIIAYLIKPKYYEDKTYSINNNKSFNTILSTSIINSIKTLLIIYGTMIFFSSFAHIINNILPISNYLKTVITGFLDLSSGMYSLKNIDISMFNKGLLALSFISFGSLTVHMQVKIILENTNIKYNNFLLGRISQVGLSILLYLLIFWCLY